MLSAAPLQPQDAAPPARQPQRAVTGEGAQLDVIPGEGQAADGLRAWGSIIMFYAKILIHL